MSSAVKWKAQCRAQAVEWAARLEPLMPVPPDQRPQLDKGWKAFCIDERARWLETHEMPSPIHFWSASACFNAYETWVRDWYEHIERVGDVWLAERDCRVAEWHSRRGEGLRMVPITHGPTLCPTDCSRHHGSGGVRIVWPCRRPSDCPTHDQNLPWRRRHSATDGLHCNHLLSDRIRAETVRLLARLQPKSDVICVPGSLAARIHGTAG